tara:strand:- start:3243 stop:3974 length:732 start_codon:yes stop_codon:yes gene_type:complete
MTTTKTNYYSNQLSNIEKSHTDFVGETKIKVVGGIRDNKTNWLDLNTESAPFLIDFLKSWIAPPTAQELERELTSTCENWVNKSFNFINLNIYNNTSEMGVIENIRQLEQDANFFSDYFDNYDLWDEYNQYLKDNEEEDTTDTRDTFSKDESTSFDSYLSDQETNNYPMWNTLFEFRSEPSEEIIEICINAGFGIIEGMDDFNTTLFVSGCGYSFYAQHWIPLWLSLPYTDNEKFANTKIEHL